eukprot:GHVR01116688.1.p1 GENE.GHVR01116688.1~~GHVR01116688.1.p1  ORF type:complete len:272 (+),score=71.58 GHVR01116688.1:51-866(+)
MTNDNISYIGVARARDQVLIASIFDKLSNNEKTEIEAVFTVCIGDALDSFAPGSRERKDCGDGSLFLMADRQLTCIYALASKDPNYPERHAFAALADVMKIVTEKYPDGALRSASRLSLSKPLKKTVMDVVERYDNLTKFDKTAEVRGKVENVKEVMQENVKKILATHGNLELLEDKTASMKDSAQQFSRNTNEVKKKERWRNVKVMVIIGVILLALLLYLLVPFMIGRGGSRDSRRLFNTSSSGGSSFIRRLNTHTTHARKYTHKHTHIE